MDIKTYFGRNQSQWRACLHEFEVALWALKAAMRLSFWVWKFSDNSNALSYKSMEISQTCSSLIAFDMESPSHAYLVRRQKEGLD